MIVDAHHHLWDPATREYAWMTGEHEPLRRPFTSDELAAEAAPLGVTATVVVQAATAEDETVQLLAVAHDERTLVSGVVGWVDLRAPDVTDRIAALRERPGGERLVGIRHPAHDEPDVEWLLRREVLAGLRAVEAAGLSYDLLLRPVHLAVATEVARQLPDLRLVVDHGAKPEIATRGWEPWSSGLAALAAHENVSCKLSGLVTEADWRAWRPEDVQRYADRLLELFGPTRLMFGSDWPVCLLAASYRQVLELAVETAAVLSETQCAALMGGTAVGVYGLARLVGSDAAAG